jgi:hypothetical protein
MTQIETRRSQQSGDSMDRSSTESSRADSQPPTVSQHRTVKSLAAELRVQVKPPSTQRQAEALIRELKFQVLRMRVKRAKRR